jgi:hypothetical protein
MGRVQVASPPEERTEAVEVATEAPAERLSLEEMLRIMDVATAFRKEQAEVHQQLNLAETKTMLRLRLREAAAHTGESLSDEQIDVAIEHYYDKLHTFVEPAGSWELVLAHVYVRRNQILGWLAGLTAAAAGAWVLFS